MDFVSFHTHTTFSYGDGYGTVLEHVNRISDLGMRALAVSEHGNVNSHAALERHCRDSGIKPIFGIEAYFGPVGDKRTQRKYHVTLFARDEEGYRNLNRIVTQSYIDSHKYPTVSPATLKKYSRGIIAFSGCADSLISCTLLGGKLLGDKRLEYTDSDYRKTSNRIQWFQDIFEDRFYLEVQRFPSLDRTCVLNPTFAKLGREHKVPLIATADVHYPFPHQNHLQAVLHAARWRGVRADFANDSAWEMQATLTYPESDEQLKNDLIGTGLAESEAYGAIINTKLLANQCNVELPKANTLSFPGAKPDSKTYMRGKIKEGWKHRLSQRPDLAERKKEYSKRVNHEFKIIADKDFCDYFLATADLVQYSKRQDITVGPGRGSGAGSLICYLMGITEIDPLHPAFDRMLFERFIDPTRSDMPDIDLDFDDELRYKIPARAREIYGNENVCNVANHTGYRGRNSLKDVARAYGLYEDIFKPIAKRIPDRTETDEFVDSSIFDTITNYQNSPDVAELLAEHGDKIRQACELEGGEHSMGVHAGGFFIASEPIPDVCPIYTKDQGTGRNIKKVQVIPYEKRDAEYLNILKMDFLGLSTMGMVGLVRKWIGMNLDKLYTMFYEHWEGPEYERVLQLFRDDDITGIFQYEGGTTREVVKKVKPSNFDELAACNALSRPGPYYGGQTKEYIAVKNGDHDWERIHPNFDKHVEWTYGQIVYQEQIMFILRDLAGFDVPTVLRVRKIIGKKLGEHQFAALAGQFVDGCASNSGLSEEQAIRLWGAITTAAGYAFNIPHAYSYALVAYWQGYFKIHNIAPFFAASLAKNGDGKKQLPRRVALLQDVKAHGVAIGDMDPSVIGLNWEPIDEKSIIPGLIQFPGVAENTAQDILAWRGDWNNIKWWDLINVKGVGEETIVKMAEFAMQADPFGIGKTSDQLSAFRREHEQGVYGKGTLPAPDQFVRSSDLSELGGESDGSTIVTFVGLVANVVERDEVESIRQRTGKPVAEIRASLDAKGKPGEYKKATLFAYDEFGEVALRVSRWRYGGLSDKISAIQPDHHIVVAQGKSYADKSNAIQVSNLWILEPD